MADPQAADAASPSAPGPATVPNPLAPRPPAEEAPPAPEVKAPEPKPEAKSSEEPPAKAKDQDPEPATETESDPEGLPVYSAKHLKDVIAQRDAAKARSRDLEQRNRQLEQKLRELDIMNSVLGSIRTDVRAQARVALLGLAADGRISMAAEDAAAEAAKANELLRETFPSFFTAAPPTAGARPPQPTGQPPAPAYAPALMRNGRRVI